MFKAFLKDRRGNFGAMAALTMVPLIGSLGLALDYGHGVQTRGLIQDKADAAALSVAKLGPGATGSAVLDQIRQSLTADSGLKNVVIDTKWVSNEYTVAISGDLPLSLSQLLPGAGSQMAVSVKSVARFKDVQRVYKPPSATLLDPNANDYNRVYAYCFDKDKKSNPTTKGRTSQVAIADNAGTVYSAAMPTCGAGETMSFRLYNVRDRRTWQSQWDNGTSERYNYYTDTELTPAETYSASVGPILETVLCPSLDKCKPTNQGGILPYGSGRTPQRATEGCSAGKFMYYGWEDRPNWDRDFDDIRVIIECASETFVGNKMARLIH